MFTVLDSNKDKKVLFDEWVAYLKSVKKKKAPILYFLNYIEHTIQNAIKGGVSIYNKLGKTILNNYIETLTTKGKISI